MRPSPNGVNGRDRRGRFVGGNTGGPGNPFNRHTSEIRAALLAAVEPSDIEAVVKVLIQRARAGEPWAVKEFLDRTIGKAMSPTDLQCIDVPQCNLPIRIAFGNELTPRAVRAV